jgi:hypothetical protein
VTRFPGFQILVLCHGSQSAVEHRDAVTIVAPLAPIKRQIRKAIACDRLPYRLFPPLTVSSRPLPSLPASYRPFPPLTVPYRLFLPASFCPPLPVSSFRLFLPASSRLFFPSLFARPLPSLLIPQPTQTPPAEPEARFVLLCGAYRY